MNQGKPGLFHSQHDQFFTKSRKIERNAQAKTAVQIKQNLLNDVCGGHFESIWHT